MLQLEAKLLWAVQAKLPYQIFGITPTCAEELWLVKSHLVSICNEVPELYFPLSDGQIQHFTMQLSNAYYNNVAKTDNINVVNDCFENSIPSVILPRANYQLRLRAEETESKTISLDFQSLPLILVNLLRAYYTRRQLILKVLTSLQ